MQPNTITIEPEKVYTKTEYSKAYNISRPTLNKKIQTKEVKSLRVKGAVLIIAA
jgi:hypothetical protein